MTPAPTLTLTSRFVAALALLASASATHAQSPDDLTELSLEELMSIDVEVTTLSRATENSQAAAAAVFVITAEDIRRIGARSIPDALRIAPGIRVSRNSSGRYAVSSRGFHWNYSDKVLVMIDGMSIYSQIFAGTEWHMFDLPVEEIDRIEIVRGPGGTMWGANAVNGVINIITRKAVGNPREEVTIVAGTEERGDLQIRGGTELNGGGALRAFVRANGRDSIGSNGTGIEDRFSQVRVGLRADVPIDERTDLILRADATSIRDDAGGEFPIGEPPYFQNLPIDRESEGVNLLGRWTRNHDSGSITSLQGSYMLLDSDSAITITNRHQFDLWATHEFEPFEGHRVMGGASFRWWTVENGDSVPIDWDESFSSVLAGAFLQDRFQATDDLALTIGAKLEYSEYAGVELQPQLRAAYTVSDDTTVWASVSRAVQTPRDVTRHSRFDFSAGPSGFPGIGAIVRSEVGPDYEPEAVVAYELGWRSRVTERFKLDAAAFFNDYNRLGVPVLGDPFLLNPTTAIVPFTYDTTGSATSYGAELVAEYALAKNLALEGAYSHIWIDEETPAGAVPNEYGEGESQHRLHIRCLWDIDDERQFDVSAYFNSGSRNGELGDVFRLDVRYGWRPNDDVEFVLMGQSLLQDDTPEDNFSLWVPVGYPEAGVYALVRFAF